MDRIEATGICWIYAGEREDAILPTKTAIYASRGVTRAMWNQRILPCIWRVVNFHHLPIKDGLGSVESSGLSIGGLLMVTFGREIIAGACLSTNANELLMEFYSFERFLK
jgi:hypothetical protein